ncbi:helix-turn-helix transcriptional regulator [Gluconacetobacter sp. 1b LMG 1731]|uniref:Helix-turn-helix transcriptional regulator n=1 Tax=Gluconacetobacter dulcium TaxID=2729096 RepID=A0A7W4IKZ0_9PROT|nr:helix-turn-helix domain-containing protein [Gluconacetobacter dulcium]MBB2164783.1 helix-turn-helix transcriptional regulator [Gluconacetobacter dulcium]MBB2193919.1 helix-turn-helix transcriptional regulator [Gluconacetobacter dulcium]
MARVECGYAHPDEETVSLEAIFHALSDPYRLRIVRTLAASAVPMNCGDLSFGRPKSSMSHHFRILRASGVLHTASHGVEHMNSLRREMLDRRFPGLMAAVLGEIGHATTTEASARPLTPA